MNSRFPGYFATMSFFRVNMQRRKQSPETAYSADMTSSEFCVAAELAGPQKAYCASVIGFASPASTSGMLTPAPAFLIASAAASQPTLVKPGKPAWLADDRKKKSDRKPAKGGPKP